VHKECNCQVSPGKQYECFTLQIDK
jgi:hypothetical protein